MVVLDTSAVIEVVDGTIKGEEIKARYGNSDISVASITINEALANTKEKEHEAFMDFFKASRVLSFDSIAAYESARVEKKLAQKGKLIGKMDILIAAICLVHNLPLVTCDNDFKKVEGLNVTVIEDTPEKSVPRKA